jgi:hypothetical protein
MADNAAAASVPYMTSPTRSRAGRCVDICAVAGVVSLFCMLQIPSLRMALIVLPEHNTPRFVTSSLTRKSALYKCLDFVLW